jgi:hypothetical protein
VTIGRGPEFCADWAADLEHASLRIGR